MQFNLQPAICASPLPFETIKMQLLKNPKPENANGNKDKFQTKHEIFLFTTDSLVETFH